MKTKKNRQTIRLQGYDYSQEGWYFITICVQDFEEMLGYVADNGAFIPNEFGEIINNCWSETPIIRKEVSLDVF